MLAGIATATEASAIGAALAVAIGISPAKARDIKIGVVGPKTGPLAAGAALVLRRRFSARAFWRAER